MEIICGDSLEELKRLPENSVDAMITDPPAGISFMGKEWDSNKGGREQWIEWLSSVMREALRVLKPGGHALVWSLPRTSHWTGAALEQAGFEVRDIISHVFGSGFPKSLDISKAIDKMKGADRRGADRRGADRRGDGTVYGIGHSGNFTSNEPSTPEAKQWDGWGTALKPAVEMWWLCRKPLGEKTIAENVLKWGTGGINIDGCRVALECEKLTFKRPARNPNTDPKAPQTNRHDEPYFYENSHGRFPSHIIHDGSEEVLAEFAKAGERTTGKITHCGNGESAFVKYANRYPAKFQAGDSGTAARFFYCAKPSPSERNSGLEDLPLLTKVFNGQSGQSSADMKPVEERFTTITRNIHPTVKAQKLMEYFITLIVPPGGTVLDPFMGSGSTGMACNTLNRGFIGIEINPEYFEIAKRRIGAA